IAAICEKHHCLLVVDEAHAVGVFGAGLVENHQLSTKVFARIVTFGKGIGCHGAAIIGSEQLKQYLINFARSLIYTTALPPHSVATIIAAYNYLSENNYRREKLQDNIAFFGREKTQLGLKPVFVKSKSAVQSAIIPGNERVRKIAGQLQSEGFDVRAILSPTVPQGQERLRFCIHSFNSEQQIAAVLSSLSKLLF
ncbi:MAG: aminotransferase class I/II-fold pyridoxal phosphate-dependent enzyme, partial [Flavobacterium sp.]|nr:aminotransferase class I/II-fold pyridoxal phosphate-dependent enzyme [Flavobacterium sp.]